MAFRFLQSIFSAAPSQPGKYDKELILAAIEWVVDGTDPRLRGVSHYRRKLWDPVERAVDFVVTFVNALPPVVAADRKSYTDDPRLRAMFASPDHLRGILSFSDGMRDYLREAPRPLPTELYAALGAARVEKNVLGMEMEGDIVRQDVAQTVVNFCDHRLVCLTDNERDTRRALMKLGFDYLTETALQRLTATRVQETQLEQEQQQLLQRKARLLRAAKGGLESLTEPVSQEPVDLAAIEQQLQDVEAELGQLRTDSATLESHMAQVAATLGEPGDYLRLEPVSLRLDHMNTIVPAGSSRIASELAYNDIVLSKGRRLAALFIRFPSSELLPQPDIFKEGKRLLG